MARRHGPDTAPLSHGARGADRLDSWAENRHAGSVDESQQWVEFGRWLAEQREQRGLRRRDAARRAKVPETLWRDLETGRKEAIGAIRLLPNPSADVLERVAGALEVPVEDVLARIGRPARRSAAVGGTCGGHLPGRRRRVAPLGEAAPALRARPGPGRAPGRRHARARAPRLGALRAVRDLLRIPVAPPVGRRR